MSRPIAAVTAEFFGAFALMFFGGGAILLGHDVLHVALAHALVLSVTVTAVMHISGGQFNPAVSVALALIGKQPWGKAMAFIMAQLIGAIVAAALLRWVFPADVVTRHNLGATLGSLSAAAADGNAAALVRLLALEAVASFTLMMVILGSAVDPRGVGKDAKVGGFAIGLTVAACILAIGPLTGASMNPCRSFGPALVGGYWAVHWVYWAGPMVGAGAAALLWKFVFEARDAR